MNYYDHFVIPFLVGVAVLFVVAGYKFVRWFVRMPEQDRRKAARGIFSAATLRSVGEVFGESLLHRKIFRTDPVLGYMHMSLAFGWFLLIAVGWVEASLYLDGFAPLHAHVFFKFFDPGGHAGRMATILMTVMDLLLLMVLSGVVLAWLKRLRSRLFGMRRATKHTTGDRLALSALWFIFPARLLAESAASRLGGGTGFLTGSLGQWMISSWGYDTLYVVASTAWWFYSFVLGVFFVAMPFSRYMHIFCEIPLIFLRNYGIRSGERPGTFDHFQIEACSRCGICIDPCQLQRDAGINGVQSVYFLRDRRYHKLQRDVTNNCLMCGRCEAKCPVGIELNTLRLNSRVRFSEVPPDDRYDYVKIDAVATTSRVGYFAGCMTSLTPRILKAMDRIFEAAAEDVWRADAGDEICCGRPLKLAGEVEAAGRMMEKNREAFRNSGIETLVTSCPICYKVFRDDYALEGIEVLHHTQYIERLIALGRIKPSAGGTNFTYHDPCELGRGSGVYEQPRAVISSIGNLTELREHGKHAFCCGSSLANIEMGDKGRDAIGAALCAEIEATGAEEVATACPLCKKAISRRSNIPVRDIAEIVAEAI